MKRPATTRLLARLSADVGSTFTDVAAFDEAAGEFRLGTTLTTPITMTQLPTP